MLLLGIHPSVPDGLVDEPRVLGNAHGIDIATGAVVLLTTGMGVGVREDNLCATAVDTLALTGTCQPVLVPADDILYGQSVLVVVVGHSTVATIEWTLTLHVVGVRPLVPIAADALVAVVFHHEHRFACRLVDIQHLATILSHLRVEHVA